MAGMGKNQPFEGVTTVDVRGRLIIRLRLADRILIAGARSHVVGWCHRFIVTVVVLCGGPPSG
jgi:hypothetical protein